MVFCLEVRRPDWLLSLWVKEEVLQLVCRRHLLTCVLLMKETFCFTLFKERDCARGRVGSKPALQEDRNI